jgi:hypothetical protein
VPVMSLDSWMHETGPAVEAATARFLSEVEDDEKSAEQVKQPIPIREGGSNVAARSELAEDPFFTTREPLVAESPIAGHAIAEKVAASAAVEHEPAFAAAMNARNGNGFHRAEAVVEHVSSFGKESSFRHESSFEPEHELPRPKFAELAEEPAYTLLPKEYASGGFGSSSHAAVAVEERVGQPPTLFPEGEEDAQRDLDVPAFMRRLQF